MTPGSLLAEVTRRDVRTSIEHVESVHSGHLAVVDGDGALVAALGDPGVELFVRSTVKPFQATTSLEVLDEATLSAEVVEAGGGSGDEGPADGELSDAEVAVAWSSHRGEPRHLDAVRRLLARSGTAPEDLTCPPASPAADRAMPPSRLTHNCSGKHAMFALAGSRLGLRGPEVIDPDETLQQRVLADLEAALGRLSAVAVDGCGAPAVRAPLLGLAQAFARFAVDPRYERIRAAGVRHPGLVGGKGRLESALLQAGVVAKVGAEASYGVGWVAPDGTPCGLAVRAADGAVRGASVVVSALLAAAGVIPGGTWEPPSPLGGGEPAGRTRASRDVQEIGERLGEAFAG